MQAHMPEIRLMRQKAQVRRDRVYNVRIRVRVSYRGVRVIGLQG